MSKKTESKPLISSSQENVDRKLHIDPYFKKLDSKGLIMVPIRDGTKKPTDGCGWRSNEANDRSANYWDNAGGIGIKCGMPFGDGYLAALDVDDLGGFLGDKFYQVLTKLYEGDDSVFLRRYGKRPKFLIPIITKEPITKLTSGLYTAPDGSTSALEVLGEGQYFVAYGVHPDTGKVFEWEGGHLGEIDANSLPKFTSSTVKDLVKAFQEMAEKAEYDKLQVEETGVRFGTSVEPEEFFEEWDDMMSPLPPKYRSAIHTMMLNLLNAPSGERNNNLNAASYFAFRKLEECGTITEDQRSDIKDFLERSIIDASLSIGLDRNETVISLESGEQSGKEDGITNRMEDEEVFEYMLENVAVVLNKEVSYYDMTSHHELGRISLNSKYGRFMPENEKGKAPPPHAVLDFRDDAIRVDDYGWWPTKFGEEWKRRTYKESSLEYVNTWTGFDITPVESDVQPWLDHLENVIPNAVERNVVLQRMAFDVQFPDEKCNWQIVIYGSGGAGKDALMTPFMSIFGRSGGPIGIASLKSNFEDDFANKKVLLVSEAGEVTKEQMQSIKEKCASTGSDFLRLTRKGKTSLAQRNLTSLYVLSNYLKSLHLERGDRRFYATHTTYNMGKESRTPYFKWLDDNGAGALMHYLMNLDLTGFDPKQVPADTEAKRDMISSSKMDWQSWIDERLENDDFPFTEEMVSPKLIAILIGADPNFLASRIKPPYFGAIKNYLIESRGYNVITKRGQKKVSGSSIPKKSSTGWLARKGSKWLNPDVSPKLLFEKCTELEVKLGDAAVETDGLMFGDI